MCAIDIYDLWEAQERAQMAAEEALPKCDWCGERIQDEHYYDINGIILCWDCLESNFKKNTEDYIG